MPDQLFTLDTLGDLDEGVTRLLVDQALAQILSDCDARPHLEKPRRATITLELRPVVADTGGMRGVDAEVTVKVNLPSPKTRGSFLPTSVHGETVKAYLPEAQPRLTFPTVGEEN